MKLTIKLFLIIALFTNVNFADEGDLGNGGYTCEGDLGNGGRICPVECTTAPEGAEIGCPENSNASSSEDSLLTSVQEYLSQLFGVNGE